MIQADVITLISETGTPRGVYDAPTETTRRVYCTIRSVGMQERYLSMSHGLDPSIVFILAHAFEYQDEDRCVYQGNEYRIIRTYRTTDDGIELVCERKKGGG